MDLSAYYDFLKILLTKLPGPPMIIFSKFGMFIRIFLIKLF